MPTVLRCIACVLMQCNR